MDNTIEPIRVLHIITRLIVGGAQENTMLTADLLNHSPAYKGRYIVEIVSGPQTGSEGSIIHEVRQRGVTLYILPELVRQPNPVKDLKTIIKLRRMMLDVHGKPRYHIVHTHSSKAGVLGRIAARWAGIPAIVHTVHGWSFHEYLSPVQRYVYVMLERLAAHFSQCLVGVSSKDVAKGLSYRIGSPMDYVLIRSGIELDRFGNPRISSYKIRRHLGIPDNATVVGSVTRFAPQKSPLDLISALYRIHQTHPDVWFVIVGDGPLRQQLQERLQGLGIADRTVLTGLRRDIPELLAAFDIFVLSSLWEGLPRVLPQAMAAGLPIVCTNAGGAADAVVDGGNGFLVDPYDPDQLAAKVDVLLRHHELRGRMGEEGRRRVPEFSAIKMVRQIDLLYRRLLKENPSENVAFSNSGKSDDQRKLHDSVFNP
jgi:glycosyltransferase involved in cell wall biosynthesis